MFEVTGYALLTKSILYSLYLVSVWITRQCISFLVDLVSLFSLSIYLYYRPSKLLYYSTLSHFSQSYYFEFLSQFLLFMDSPYIVFLILVVFLMNGVVSGVGLGKEELCHVKHTCIYIMLQNIQ